MGATVSTHKEYQKNIPLVLQVRDTIEGQAHMRKVSKDSERYIKKTSSQRIREGMDIKATATFYDFVDRARALALVPNAIAGIIGMALSEEPHQDNMPYERVTINGRSVVELAVSMLNEIPASGKSVLVIDAPASGGNPYIVEYQAEDLIDWHVDENDNSKLVMAKLKEEYFADDDLDKCEPLIRYRKYSMIEGYAHYQLFDDSELPLNGSVPTKLPIKFMPVLTVGSIDMLPAWDRIPMLPVSDCVVSMFRTSADYEQWLSICNQGTPYATGVGEDEAKGMLMMGLGVGAFWSTTSKEANIGMLEAGVATDQAYMNKFDRELATAAELAVAITSQGSGVEAAESLKLRAMTKHATIYTMFDSVSRGIQAALMMMKEWGGVTGKDPEFRINTDFTDIDIDSQMLLAIMSGVGQEYWPKSVVRAAGRKLGIIEESVTDDDLDREISVDQA